MKEAELSMMRRVGWSERNILAVQGNLANTYRALGRREQALSTRRNVYSGIAKINGEEHEETLLAADNYTLSLLDLEHFEDAKALLRKVMPVARRVLGESNDVTLRMRWNYAKALCEDDAPLDDLREAVNSLEETTQTARRVLGGAHPLTVDIERDFQNARAALGARDVEPLREAVEAMTAGDA